MTIAIILDRQQHEVVTARCEQSVREVVELFAKSRIGAVPVVKDGIAVGVFSERDVVYCLASEGAEVLDWPVEKVMTSPVIAAERSMSVLAALSLMTQRRIRHLPVVEGNRFTGFVSIGDLVKYRIDKIESEAAAMRDYIQAV